MPPAARVGWPTTAPPHRALGTGDPTSIGPYRLEALLGEGGMGRVFLGRTPAGSAVAVKVVHREYAADPAFRKRFEQEVATARRVQGLYTVPVVDADIGADEPWLATAYVAGPSLQYAVVEYGPLPVAATLDLVGRVAEALQSIHAAGVIHRDLKPSNVILTAEGPRVIDFGIARAADVTSITGTGPGPGTPAYMAPEHIDGKTLTAAADVFALGLVANYAVTGELAFGGGSAPVVIRRITEREPDLESCPEPVRAVVAACLVKDPERRPTPDDVIRRCREASASPTLASTLAETAIASGNDGRPSPPPPAPSPWTPPSPVPGAGPPPAGPAAPPAPPPMAPPPPAGPPRPDIPPRNPYAPAPVGPRPDLPATRQPMGSAAKIVAVVGAAFFALVLVSTVAFVSLRPDRNVANAPVRAPKPAPASRKPLSLTDDLKVGRAVFSPDGKLLAATVAKDTDAGLVDAKVRLWDVASRRQVATLDHADRVASVTFSPDGTRLATASDDHKVRLWEVAEHRLVATFRGGSTPHMSSVAFSPDGRTLAAGNQDDKVRLWDVAKRRQIATLDHTEYVMDVAFSPDGRTLASGGGDNTVRLWDVAKRRQIATLTGHTRTVKELSFSRDGRTLASAGTDNTVRLWDMAKRRQVATLRGGPDDELNVSACVAFSPDGRRVAYAIDDDNQSMVKLSDVSGRLPATPIAGGGLGYGSVAFSPDGRTLATVGVGTYSLELWNLG